MSAPRCERTRGAPCPGGWGQGDHEENVDGRVTKNTFAPPLSFVSPSPPPPPILPMTDAPAADTTHPLEHRWTLWFDNPRGPSKGNSWG